MRLKKFNIVLSKSLTKDIQEAVDYYKTVSENLGERFYSNVKSTMSSLRTNALIYQIKYRNIRCVRLTKFPYLIHYSVDITEKKVYVHGLICCFKNPEESWIKK